MIKKGLVLISLLSTLAFTAPASAKLFKWVDEHGTTHYGETIPPEYANRSSQTLGKSGKVTTRSEAFDPDRQKNLQEAADKKKADDAAAAEIKRRDSALLNTYSNENEIELSRNRSVQLLRARVDSFTTMVRSAEESLVMLNKEVEDRQKAGKKVSQSLQDDIANSEARIVRLKKDLAQSEQEMITVQARFDADKARFRELKGITSKP